MSKGFLAVLLAVLLGCSISKPIVAGKVIVALNCGTKDEVVQSFDKIFKYQGDQSFVSGKSVPVDYHSNDAAKEADILYTFDKKLYMFQRHTYDEMTYTLPVKNGKNTLILKFAEMYFTSPGQRVFNIKIGNQIVRKDFDVIQRAGKKYAAHQEYIEIQVKNDGVYYEGVKIPGALSKNKIRLSFSKGKNDNPIVQGIIVYHDSIQNSPQSQFNKIKSTWDKQKQLQKAMKDDEKLKEKINIQKKKEKIVIRNDQIIVEKSEPVAQASGPRQKYGFIRKLLMGPVGIIIWSIAFAAAIFFMYKHVFLMESKSSESEANN